PASNGMADLNVFNIMGSPQSGTTLYALTASGLYKASGGADQWTGIGPDIGSNFNLMTMDPKNPSLLVVQGKITENQVAPGVLLGSADGGQSWSVTAPSLPFSDARSLEFSPVGSGLLCAATSGLGVFQSRNLGQSWNAINTGLPPAPADDIVQSAS